MIVVAVALGGAPHPSIPLVSGPAVDPEQACAGRPVRFACALSDGRQVWACGDANGVEALMETSDGSVPLGSVRSPVVEAPDRFRRDLVLSDPSGRPVYLTATRHGGGIQRGAREDIAAWTSCAQRPTYDFRELQIAVPTPGSEEPSARRPMERPPVREGLVASEGAVERCRGAEAPLFACRLDDGRRVLLCGLERFVLYRDGALPELEHSASAGVGPIERLATFPTFLHISFEARGRRYEVHSSVRSHAMDYPHDGGVRVFEGEVQTDEWVCAHPPFVDEKSVSRPPAPTPGGW